ncbi:MAG: carbohydrate binding domain-containing protein [Acidobacteriota bacterium]
MSTTSVPIRTTARRIGLLVIVLIAVVANFYSGRWALANMAASHTDIPEVADLTTSLGPNDPQTHFAAGVLYEKSFLPDDLARSLNEYSIAASLSPHNYLFWLDLGNARSRSGDLKGAEGALRVAADLAPNYGSVRWALGNVLLRQGRADEAFVEIRKAGQSEPNYALAAADIALQYFNGNINDVREKIGESPEIIGALIDRMAAQKRLDDAVLLWNTLSSEQRSGSQQSNGKGLYTQLAAAKRFRAAAGIETDLTPGIASATIAAVLNGDFESDIKLHDASIFEWAIGDGTLPQIVLTDGKRRNGGRSLLVSFGGGDVNSFRSISQIVLVEPGKAYSFEAFSQSDIKTRASVDWEIVDASDGKVLATTPMVSPAADWMPLTATFTVPSTTDAVIVRLAKSACSGQTCAVEGRVWFDDISIRAK